MAEEENEEGTTRETGATSDSSGTFVQPNFQMRVRLSLEGGHTQTACVPRMSAKDFADKIFGLYADETLLDQSYMCGYRTSSIVSFAILVDHPGSGAVQEYDTSTTLDD